MAGIIQSYGVLWKADDVYWGRGYQRSKLLGVWARARSSREIDFRDQIGIYVLYRREQIVYVGQTGSGNARLFHRLRRHRKDALAGRWDRFSWFGLRKVLRSGRLSVEKMRAGAKLAVALNHIEAVLIEAAEPTLNKQGGRFGRDARKYLQKRDPRLGLTDRQMLRKLLRETDRLGGLVQKGLK